MFSMGDERYWRDFFFELVKHVASLDIETS